MNAKKDLFQYLELYSPDTGIIPLSMGAPGPSAMKGCSELLMEATRITLSDKAEEQFTFQYGPCKGDPGFREQLAKFLSQEYGDIVDCDDVMVTAGATQGLHLISTVMFDKTTPVFMEDPSYFIALKMLKEDFGMNIIPIPTDNEGIDVTILEEQFKKQRPTTIEGLKSPFWAYVYTIPTFNNPKGHCMSPERCKALVSLARKYDVMLLAEDVYNLLHYSGDKHPPPRLLTYDSQSDADYKGHVLSNCTFSKLLGPGLRLGWIEAPPRIMKCLEKSNTAWSGGAFNHYTSKLMATALKEEFMTEHLNKLRQEYKERMELVHNELKKHLPEGVTYNFPGGGFFIWLELPERIDSAELLKYALEKHQVNFIFGQSTSPTGSYKNCARLSISFCDKDKLQEGVKRFCNALKDMLNTT